MQLGLLYNKISNSKVGLYNEYFLSTIKIIVKKIIRQQKDTLRPDVILLGSSVSIKKVTKKSFHNITVDRHFCTSQIIAAQQADTGNAFRYLNFIK